MSGEPFGHQSAEPSISSNICIAMGEGGSKHVKIVPPVERAYAGNVGHASIHWSCSVPGRRRNYKDRSQVRPVEVAKDSLVPSRKDQCIKKPRRPANAGSN